MRPSESNRYVGKLLEADAAVLRAVSHEAFIAFDFAGRDARDFALHRGLVGQAVEMAAVVEDDAIVGIELPKVDVVR
jgi:hypothetical protein